MKKFRKSIRLDGKLVSKEFTRAEDAKAWYSQLHSKKVMGEFDLMSSRKDKILFKEFALGEFMQNRRKNYPLSTWKADEQRLRDHVLPVLGSIALAKLKSDKLRAFLAALVEKKGLSPKTRDRIQALVSVIYTEAINRDAGALVGSNPTYGLTFRRGKRKGVKAPSFLQTHKDVIKYLKTARTLSLDHLGVGALGIMAGLRKQEMIALRIGRIDFDSHSLEVSEKFEQASGKIMRGTKGGEDSTRHVPMSPKLEEILHDLCDRGAGAKDFVLQNLDGSHMGPKQIYKLNAETCKEAGLDITVHGLRHTFGREFAERSGNMQALKDILGHSNFSTTQLYSTLGKDRLSGFKDVMDLDV